MFDFNRYHVIINSVNDQLKNWLTADVVQSSVLQQAMEYSVLSDAKRVRAILLVQYADFLQIPRSISIYLAACIELIHTYTLVHDDLPAMDNSDYRRGILTNHKKFNEYTAILVGDCLQSKAFELLSSDQLPLADESKIKLIHTTANIIGSNYLLSGQMLDLQHQINTIDDVLLIAELKTAKLFELCVLLPAIVAQQDVITKELIRQYANKLGLIYQLYDDYVDRNDHDLTNILNFIDVNQLINKINAYISDAQIVADELLLPQFFNQLLDYFNISNQN